MLDRIGLDELTCQAYVLGSVQEILKIRYSQKKGALGALFCITERKFVLK